eukprot:Nk52_evm3s2118 gene=Nk52_evmTU3s2118
MIGEDVQKRLLGELDKEITTRKAEVEECGVRIRNVRLQMARLRGSLLKKALKDDFLLDTASLGGRGNSLSRRWYQSECDRKGGASDEEEEEDDVPLRLFVLCGLSEEEGGAQEKDVGKEEGSTPKARRRKMVVGTDVFLMLKCPSCERSDFRNVLGFQNHCRIVHNLFFTNQLDMYETCGEIVEDCASVVPPDYPLWEEFSGKRGCDKIEVPNTSMEKGRKNMVQSEEKTVGKTESEEKETEDVEGTKSKDIVKKDENKADRISGGSVSWSRFHVSKEIIVGNISQYIPPEKREGGDRSTHKWMVYVRAVPGEISANLFVKMVRFFLHPSYRPNDVIEVTSPPFQLSRRGWGEFPVRVQLHFKDSSVNKPVDVIHYLKLDRGYSGLQCLGAETKVDVKLDRVFFETLMRKQREDEMAEGPAAQKNLADEKEAQKKDNVKEQSIVPGNRQDSKGPSVVTFTEWENAVAVRPMTLEKESKLVLGKYILSEKDIADMDSIRKINSSPLSTHLKEYEGQEFEQQKAITRVYQKLSTPFVQYRRHSLFDEDICKAFGLRSSRDNDFLGFTFEESILCEVLDSLFSKAVKIFPVINSSFQSPMGNFAKRLIEYSVDTSSDHVQEDPSKIPLEGDDFQYTQARSLEEFLQWSYGKKKCCIHSRSVCIYNWVQQNLFKKTGDLCLLEKRFMESIEDADNRPPSKKLKGSSSEKPKHRTDWKKMYDKALVSLEKYLNVKVIKEWCRNRGYTPTFPTATPPFNKILKNANDDFDIKSPEELFCKFCGYPHKPAVLDVFDPTNVPTSSSGCHPGSTLWYRKAALDIIEQYVNAFEEVENVCGRALFPLATTGVRFKLSSLSLPNEVSKLSSVASESNLDSKTSKSVASSYMKLVKTECEDKCASVVGLNVDDLKRLNSLFKGRQSLIEGVCSTFLPPSSELRFVRECLEEIGTFIPSLAFSQTINDFIFVPIVNCRKRKRKLSSKQMVEYDKDIDKLDLNCARYPESIEDDRDKYERYHVVESMLLKCARLFMKDVIEASIEQLNILTNPDNNSIVEKENQKKLERVFGNATLDQLDDLEKDYEDEEEEDDPVKWAKNTFLRREVKRGVKKFNEQHGIVSSGSISKDQTIFKITSPPVSKTYFSYDGLIPPSFSKRFLSQSIQLPAIDPKAVPLLKNRMLLKQPPYTAIITPVHIYHALVASPCMDFLTERYMGTAKEQSSSSKATAPTSQAQTTDDPPVPSQQASRSPEEGRAS